jgi:hypothetical protein
VCILSCMYAWFPLKIFCINYIVHKEVYPSLILKTIKKCEEWYRAEALRLIGRSDIPFLKVRHTLSKQRRKVLRSF